MNDNAYGRVADWNARNADARVTVSSNPSTTKSRADTRLQERFSETCTALKATGRKIIIYVIRFEVPDTGTRTRLQTCASGTARYFEAPSASDLSTAVTRIANELVSLRLVE